MPRRSSFVASVLALLTCLLSGAWAQDCAEGYGATVRLLGIACRRLNPRAVACAPLGHWPRLALRCALVLTVRWFPCLQMDQIINVVGEVYSMQLEVDAAIRAITVRQMSGAS